MSDAQNAPSSGEEARSDRTDSALFAQLVLQQSNMALMLLGKVAHPESGQVVRDLEAARLFIDQLEMLEAKTRGNLTKDESSLLKQSLMTLHLAFVQAAEEPAPKPASTPQSEKTEASPQAGTTSEDEARKKFSKKY